MKRSIVLLIRDPELRNSLAQSFRERDHGVTPRFQSEGWVTLLKGAEPGALLLIGSDIADADPRLLARKASTQFPQHIVAQVGKDDDGGIWLNSDAAEIQDAGPDEIVALAEESLAPRENGVYETPANTVEDGPALPVRICGKNPEIDRILRMIDTVAPTVSTVLIQGESGTGKDLFARLIHQKSRRFQGPWVTVNCGAIPPSLMESELFGHEKGAFTGADAQKNGLFVVADGGTLFLDEIGELPLDTQVKLLRVLQSGSFRPVGATDIMKVDVRIVAATNRDLKEEVRAGRFRLDLFYRLNVISMEIPPLRQRPDDFVDLVQSIMEGLEKKGISGAPFDTRTMRILMDYSWPGNIRELENIVERLLLLHPDGRVPEDETRRHLRDLGMHDGLAPEGPRTSGPELPYAEDMTLKEIEEAHIRRVLAKHQGNKTRAARALGINVKTLYNKMKIAGLTREEFMTVDA